MLKLCIAIISLALTLPAFAAEPNTLRVGTTAPRLDFRLLDGTPAPSWPALKGKVVVIDFWASWCGPCVASIPHLDALKAAMAKEPVAFYSVTYEPRGKAQAFLKKHPMATAVGVDNDMATFEAFLAWGIPMTYVIDREGKVAAVVHPTKLTADHLRAALAGRPVDAPPHPGWDDPAGAAKYFRSQLEEDRKKYGRD